MGLYHRIPGLTVNQRPVWYREGGVKYVFFYHTRVLVGKNFNIYQAGIQSKDYRLDVIPLSGYQYSYNGWQEDDTLTITAGNIAKYAG